MGEWCTIESDPGNNFFNSKVFSHFSLKILELKEFK